MSARRLFPVPYRKGRPANVIGAHAVISFEGRELIGTIEAIDYQEFPVAGYFASVRHFDGTSWTIKPNLGSLMLLDRKYGEVE